MMLFMIRDTVNFIFIFMKMQNKVDRQMLIDINYCPWSGSKFLTSLANTWFKILDKDYNQSYRH